jgi:hypothetical protein
LTARLSNVLKVLAMAMAMAAIFPLLVSSVEPSEASKKHCHRHHHAKRPCHGKGGSGRSFLWGAGIGKQLTGTQAPWDWNAVTAFEQQNTGGNHISALHFASPFISGDGSPYNFDSTAFNTVKNHNATPFFSWADWYHTDAQIAAGAEDPYITRWATAAKSNGQTILLRFAWEMNGSWFGWGLGNGANGPPNTAADYVAMWRHVHQLFVNAGATNVKWVWCPNAGSSLATLQSLYPGDSYVDWTCLDGYNGNNPWRSFADLFGSSYDNVMQIAPSKPMIVGEVGSTESGGSKAQWITDMFAALPTRFPDIHGLLWFNVYESGPGGYTDWPLETSSSSSAAFAAGVGPLASTPPQTSLGKHPKKKTSKSTAKFTFSSDEPDSSFQCKLDKKPFRLCGSPKKYKHLKPKKHVFRVASVDAACNLDPTPSTFKWKVLR